MKRIAYQLTEKQIAKAEFMRNLYEVMPSDDEIKAQFAKSHHGKERGWGMLKKDYALKQLQGNVEYQRGLGQGRVDKARGLAYSEERSESAYNMGYHRGYADYESNRSGWDTATRERFDAQYMQED